MLLARRRIMMAKQGGATPSLAMVLLINSPNTGDFSVATNYGAFTAVKVSDYSYFNTTVTHKLSISDVTFSTGQRLSDNSAVRKLFVGVESWGTSNTYTNTSYLFFDHPNLRGIPASWEGLDAVTNTSNMFYYCTSLASIPDSWQGLGAVTNAGHMFRECTSLTSTPDSWQGLVNVTNAIAMFQRCTSLASIPASWEGLGAVTNAGNMFTHCATLTSIPASWEGLGAVTNASYMFYGCTAITNCGTTFTGLDMATDVSYLFAGCTGMRGDIHALYVYLSTKPVAVKNFSSCFRDCTQAIGYESIPASWK